MDMLGFQGLLEESEESIPERLEAAPEPIPAAFAVSRFNCPPTAWHNADRVLILWYTAERVAAHSRTANLRREEVGSLGDEAVTLELSNVDCRGLARTLSELVPAFDPDGDEAPEFLEAEAEDSLENRGQAAARFPELETEYREARAYTEAAEPEDDDD